MKYISAVHARLECKMRNANARKSREKILILINFKRSTTVRYYIIVCGRNNNILYGNIAV